MEPEIITPVPGGNKMKYLIVTLVAILVVAGVAYWYLFMQKDTSMPVEEVVTVVPVVKSPEQIERERILAELVKAIPKDTTSDAEKAQILKNLSKNIPSATMSNEERLMILHALASSTPK